MHKPGKGIRATGCAPRTHSPKLTRRQSTPRHVSYQTCPDPTAITFSTVHPSLPAACGAQGCIYGTPSCRLHIRTHLLRTIKAGAPTPTGGDASCSSWQQLLPWHQNCQQGHHVLMQAALPAQHWLLLQFAIKARTIKVWTTRALLHRAHATMFVMQTVLPQTVMQNVGRQCEANASQDRALLLWSRV